jgi:DNA-directed RNA polymerase subunit RPC12/RpoP
MVDFITIKCPGCGRDMQLDLINRNGSCSHCASKVNYRDAKSLPTHISAEPGEIERFAHASQALQGSENIENERSPEMSDPVLTDNGKEIDYNKKKKNSSKASIVVYSIILLLIIVLLMSVPGVVELFSKSPFFIFIIFIFVGRIGLSIFKLTVLNKGTKAK